MGKCCDCQLICVLEDLVREFRLFRKLSFPMDGPSSLGETRTISEETVDMTTFMNYEQTHENLPEATGNNKDIDHGDFVVEVDGVEFSRTRVDYDLTTRAPLAVTPWKAEKGKSVTLKLDYVDDDGNVTPFTSFDFGVAADTIAPDAPAGLGTTKVVSETDE